MTKAIYKVGVIGGGTMGRGIALLISQKGIPVVIKEVNRELADKSLRSVHEKLDLAVARGKLMSDTAEVAKGLVSATADFEDISDVDLVIEAVFENLEVKRSLFSNADKLINPDAIFATNTSSLSISEIMSVTLRPDKFIGMHFFNPPITMPLVELISGQRTSEGTLCTVENFAKDSLGKITIRVKECPAFLVNRLLMPYLNEATFLLTDTCLSVEEIDQKAGQFGWPMGPFLLLDYLGIDIASDVACVCYAGYGERAKPAPLMNKLVQLGRLGNKSGAGFYVNDTTKQFESLSVVLEKEYSSRKSVSIDDGFRRMMVGMVNEAFLCLEEGVSSADAVETGCLYGIGFPMAFEGPLHWAEKEGLINILKDLKRFEKECGVRFKPAKLLEKYVAGRTRIFESW